jgi:hypothetical protein
MLFTKCDSVSRISSISPLTINFDTTITIQGSGFSSIPCENHVLINRKECRIVTSSASQIECKLGANSLLEPNKFYDIEVLVDNIGFALQDKIYQIEFKPVITSVSPLIGSKAGGTEIIIDGDGFTAQSLVRFINSQLNNFNRLNFKSLDYNRIVLVTLPENEGVYNLSISIGDLNNAIECLNCSFEFNSTYASIINSVTPISVDQANVEITIVGSNFDSDLNRIKVNIGQQECSVTFATETEIKCLLNGLNLGENKVTVNIKDNGDSLSNNLRITGLPSIKSLTPNSGSLNGGTRVKITGNGFNGLTNTSVKFGSSSVCHVLNLSLTELECETSSASGNLLAQVNVNDVAYANSDFSFLFDSNQTPTISSVSPSNDNTFSNAVNNILTLSGSGFGSVPGKN